MKLPKFLLGDHSDHPDAVYVIHTQFPRFIINLETEAIEWFEDFDPEDEKDLRSEAENAVVQATAFYDLEVSKYE